MDKKVLVVAPDSFDVSDMGTDMLEAQVFGDISDDEHEVAFEANFDIAFEVEWEDDGEPTYVPYGSTRVLYDSGEGGIDSIDIVDTDLSVDSWINVTDDADGVELTDDEVEELFGMSIDDIKKQILDQLNTYVENNAEQYIEKHAEKPDIDWLNEEYLLEDIDDAYIDEDIDEDDCNDEEELADAKKSELSDDEYKVCDEAAEDDVEEEQKEVLVANDNQENI